MCIRDRAGYDKNNRLLCYLVESWIGWSAVSDFRFLLWRISSYCAIPIITGRHVSRPMEEILDEVKYLVARDVYKRQELFYQLIRLILRHMAAHLLQHIVADMLQGNIHIFAYIVTLAHHTE